MPLAQLYTEEVATAFKRLKAKAVAFRDEPKKIGPTRFVDFAIREGISFGSTKVSS